MPEVGSASIAIIPSFKGFGQDLERGTAKAMAAAGVRGGTSFGDSAGKSMASRFGGYAKNAAKAAAFGLAAVGVGVLKVGADSIQAASDLEESTNKVQQVFGKGAERVFRFSEQAADKLGQTNQQARDAAATFGIFGKVAKLSGRENAKFAKGLTILASDLASFNNTSPEEAIEAIGAALRGEAEPIRKYGVLLDEATLKAEAMSMGLIKPVKDQAKIKSYQVAILDGQKKYNDAVKKHGEESIEALKAEAALGTSRDRLKKATEGTIAPLTQQQKVLAAQSAIMKQTDVAQGDFARTSDGLANQQRRMKARFADAKAELGKGLLPIMTDAADFLLDKGIPAFEDFSEWFTKKGVPALKDFGGYVKDEIFPVVKKFGGKLETVAGHAKDLAKFLNDLPAPAKIAGLTALLGGGAALKLRGGGGGALGGAGKVLGLAKPVPVFVTNPGGIGGGGAGSPGKAGLLTLAGPVTLVVAGTVASKTAGVIPGVPVPDLSSDDSKLRFAKTANMMVTGWDKVRNAVGLVTDAVLGYDSTVENVPTLWKTVFEAPGLARDKALAQQYGSLIDGLPPEVKVRFTTSVTNNNDTGEGGGTNPQPPGRSGPSVVINHNGDIRSDSPRDYTRNMQRRARVVNGGGVDW